VLYTADSQFTALQEVEALFLDEAGGLRGVPRNPDLILTLECSLLSMLNLTDAGLLEQLGTSYEELIAESPSRFIENARGRSTPTQQLGSACFRSGHISAINAPSAAIHPDSASTYSPSACLRASTFVSGTTRENFARNWLGRFLVQTPDSRRSALKYPD